MIKLNKNCLSPLDLLFGRNSRNISILDLLLGEVLREVFVLNFKYLAGLREKTLMILVPSGYFEIEIFYCLQ